MTTASSIVRGWRALLVAILAVVLLMPAAAALPQTEAKDKPLPPAPPGFKQELIDVYREMRETAIVVTRELNSNIHVPEPPTVVEYAAKVNSLDAKQVSFLYEATRKAPAWKQVPGLLRKARSRAAEHKPPTPPGHTRSHAVLSSGTEIMLVSSPLARDATASASTGGSAVVPASAVFEDSECIDSAGPNGSSFALKLAAIILIGIYEGVVAGQPKVEPAATIIGVIAGGWAIAIIPFEITVDVLNNVIALAAVCKAENDKKRLASIDQTTVATSNLLGAASADLDTLSETSGKAADSLESGATGSASAVDDLQAEADAVIAAARSAIQTTIGTDSQLLASRLSTTSSRLQDATTASTQTLVTDIADSVTTLEDATEAAQAQAKAQAQAALRLAIERALLSTQTSPAVDAFTRPAADGGYLDAKPVGVRQVVLDTRSAMDAAKMPTSTNADSYLKRADADLAQGNHLSAFDYYSRAYVALAQ